MKRFVTFSLVILALLTMGFSDVLTHPVAAHTRWGAFNSTPDSYSYVAYASIPTNASWTDHTYFGPYGSSWVGCTTYHSAQESNHATQLAVAKMATVRDGRSLSNIERTNTNTSAQATVNAHMIDVLQGTVYADSIQATANSDMTSTNVDSAASSVWFSQLSINGRPFEEHVPAPNTRVTLDGMGYVMLNEQYPINQANITHMIVNLIHVYITQENKLVRNGAQIIIGHTETTITRTSLPHILRSNLYDYSASMHVPLNDRESHTLATHIACTGGSSQTHSVSQLPFAVGYSGLAVENTSGRILSGGSNNTGQVHISNLHLLQGLIEIESVNVSAYVERSSHTIYKARTMFMNAHIADTTLNSAVRPNTRIPLQGIGDVTLNEQSSTVSKSYIEQQVNALNIHVTQKNDQDIPVGTHIIVGHVSVAIGSY